MKFSTHPNRNKLDDKTKQEIKRLWKKGYFKHQICKKLGVSLTAVDRHIKEREE